jgi:hypothetical protein
MSPEWIMDAYEVWLRGDDVDLAEVSHAETLTIRILLLTYTGHFKIPPPYLLRCYTLTLWY